MRTLYTVEFGVDMLVVFHIDAEQFRIVGGF